MSKRKEMLEFIDSNESDVLKIPIVEPKILILPLLDRGYEVLEKKLESKSLDEIVEEVEK